MSFPTGILACGSMHFPWWVGPAVLYLLIGWATSGFLTLFNLVKISTTKRSSDFKTSNIAVWALYASPVMLVALAMCHLYTPSISSIPAWVGYSFCAYVFLVPPLAVWHTVFLIRKGSLVNHPGKLRPFPDAKPST